MVDIVPSKISLKCPSLEYILLYNEPPQSGLTDNVPWQPTESILLYNEPPQSGLVDNVARTEFFTYTN